MSVQISTVAQKIIQTAKYHYIW